MLVDVQNNYPLKNLTSFKIGGNAEHMYFPQTVNEMVYLLKTLDKPLVMGNWSNALVSSQGIEGNVISTQFLNKIEKVSPTRLLIEAGVKGPMASQFAAENGLSGFEFMSGFPGSIGGNLYMHASASGQAISDRLLHVNLFDYVKKCEVQIPKEELEFVYRSSLLQKLPVIALSAEFELESKNPEEIKKQIKENLEFRRSHQPTLALPNVGSIFKNPEGHSAGALLDDVGAKSFSVCGAKVWENHANFIVNPNKNATSSDVLELMFKMYNAVKEKHGIKLHPEVKYFGKQTEREEYICIILYSQS